MGTFQRLEAQQKNMADIAREQSGAMAGPLLKALADANDKELAFVTSLKAANPELHKQLLVWGYITPEMKKAVAEYDHAQAAADYYRRQLAALGETQVQTAASAEDLARKIKETTDANQSFLSLVLDVSSAQERYNQGVKAADAALAAHKITTKEHAATIAELSAEYDKAAKQIVADLLLIKMTADGAFDDQEVNAYLGALVPEPNRGTCVPTLLEFGSSNSIGGQ